MRRAALLACVLGLLACSAEERTSLMANVRCRGSSSPAACEACCVREGENGGVWVIADRVCECGR